NSAAIAAADTPALTGSSIRVETTSARPYTNVPPAKLGTSPAQNVHGTASPWARRLVMSNAMVHKSAAEASQGRSTPVFVSTTLLRATGRENKYCADPRLNSPATAVDPKMMATMTTAWYKFFAC